MLKWEGEKLGSQIIPPSRFRSFSGEGDETGRASGLASFPVKGPDGRPRVASLSSTGSPSPSNGPGAQLPAARVPPQVSTAGRRRVKHVIGARWPRRTAP